MFLNNYILAVSHAKATQNSKMFAISLKNVLHGICCGNLGLIFRLEAGRTEAKLRDSASDDARFHHRQQCRSRQAKSE